MRVTPQDKVNYVGDSWGGVIEMWYCCGGSCWFGGSFLPSR